jgi:hypothetical protein
MQSIDGTTDRSSGDGAKRRRIRAGVTLLLACAIAAGLVLSIFAGALPPVAGLVAVALLLTAVFWRIRAHLPSILLVFIAVLFAAVVVTHRLPKLRADRNDAREADDLSRKWAASGRFNENLPIVVHLVFDEMMSTGGMTSDLPGGERTRRLLLDFGEKHAFRVFDSVYSRYWTTGRAIPNMMNREYLGRTSMDPNSQLPYDPETRSFSLETNAYFEDMAGRGYRTAVFQVPFMNFCANRNVDLCETFDSFDPGGGESTVTDSPTLRVNLWQTVLRAYAPSYTSSIGQKILARAYALGTSEVGVQGLANRYDAQRFPEWFDRFTRFTAAVPRGTHVFAHFLVPHAPYFLLESCVVSGKEDTGYYLAYPPKRPEMRSDFYNRYLGQVRCVANELDRFMATIGRSENFRDALIVIHGDHGSRISSGDTLEDYNQRDFVDNYATFFAVRSPAVKPGVDCELVSLPEVFRRYAARGVQSRPRTGAPLPVIVQSRAVGNAEVEAPMPPFGCAAGTATVSE